MTRIAAIAIAVWAGWAFTSSLAREAPTKGQTASLGGGAPGVIFLLVDISADTVSNSFSFGYVDARKRLATVIERQFINRLAPTDRLRVGTFGSRLSASPEFTTNRRQSVSAIATGLADAGGDRFGASPVWDVLAESVLLMADQPQPRSIVLLTGGRATANRRTFAEAARAAMDGGITVHVVSAAIDEMVPQGDASFLHSRPSDRLRELTRLTAGQFLEAPGADREYRRQMFFESFESYRASRTHSNPPTWDPDPGRAFSEIAARLHSQAARD